MQITIDFNDMAELRRKIADAEAFFAKNEGSSADGGDAQPEEPKPEAPPKGKPGRKPKAASEPTPPAEPPAPDAQPASASAAPTPAAQPPASTGPTRTDNPTDLRERAIKLVSDLIEAEKKEIARGIILKTGVGKVKDVAEDKLAALVAELEAATAAPSADDGLV